MLRAPEGTVSELAKALHDLEGSIRECDICATFCVSERCALCSAPGRDHTLICVVEHPQDILAFERSGEFRGLYHVLHGAILATNPTVEGDSTALYLSRLLDPIEVKVSRLAHGISVGTEIEYADAISLARALQNRTLFGAL